MYLGCSREIVAYRFGGDFPCAQAELCKGFVDGRLPEAAAREKQLPAGCEDLRDAADHG